MNMLEQIFGSRTRTKLLKLFLTNPQQPFYIRELTRVIDTQINSVRRELTNLEDCGLIVTISEEEAKQSREKADPYYTARLLFGGAKEKDTEEEMIEDKSDKQTKKYYRANHDFVLYKELKSLFEKSPLIVERDLTKAIQQMGTIEYAMLSGFFAGVPDAPVDILLVGQIDKAVWEAALKKIEQELERELKYTTMTVEEYKLRKSVTDRFLFTLLESPKKVLVNKLG